MTNIATLKLLLAGATTILLSLLGSLYVADTTHQVPTVVGSVAITNDYLSTTTATAIVVSPAQWYLVATSSTDISSHNGTFGSFVQTAAGTAGGNINIYDATTTNVNLRTGNLATSSMLLASLPTNAAVGTYTYDVQFKRGLMIIIDGTVGTTTLTYRILK